MKTLKIEVIIQGNKVANAIRKQGFNKDMSGELEVLGILENLKEIQKDKLKILARGGK